MKNEYRKALENTGRRIYECDDETKVKISEGNYVSTIDKRDAYRMANVNYHNAEKTFRKRKDSKRQRRKEHMIVNSTRFDEDDDRSMKRASQKSWWGVD